MFLNHVTGRNINASKGIPIIQNLPGNKNTGLSYKKIHSECRSINNTANPNRITTTSTENSETMKIQEDFTNRLNEILTLNKKTNDIMRMIERLAFQTNTLALEAAVEAVRAGDSEYGFTVIANELRNLAKNTTTVLKEINYIFNDTIEKSSENINKTYCPSENLNDIQTKMTNTVNTFNDIYTSFTKREENPDRTFMETNNTSQKNPIRTDRKESVRNAALSQKDNTTGLDMFVKGKKPTIH